MNARSGVEIGNSKTPCRVVVIPVSVLNISVVNNRSVTPQSYFLNQSGKYSFCGADSETVGLPIGR